MARKKLTFEDAMDELRTIYEELEEGNVGLDDLEKLMKRVKELTDFCKRKLRDVEALLK